jgi:hypothetical protein
MVNASGVDKLVLEIAGLADPASFVCVMSPRCLPECWRSTTVWRGIFMWRDVKKLLPATFS